MSLNEVVKKSMTKISTSGRTSTGNNSQSYKTPMSRPRSTGDRTTPELEIKLIIKIPVTISTSETRLPQKSGQPWRRHHQPPRVPKTSYPKMSDRLKKTRSMNVNKAGQSHQPPTASTTPRFRDTH